MKMASVSVNSIDFGDSKSKLDTLKAKLKDINIVNTYKNPEDLHGKALHSLIQTRDLLRSHKELKEASHSERYVIEIDQNTPTNLPPLPEDIELPQSPYRRLQWFRREDAGIFFGRKREIIKLYEILTAQWTAPIVLLFGESGVGKSSLLSAGVCPRLEASHEVRYLRRDGKLGIVGTLEKELSSNPVNGWHALEECINKPLIIILDQIEELFTRKIEDKDEISAFLEILKRLFAVRQNRPNGKLLLSFRKEWIADLEKHLSEALLPHDKVFLERLTVQGIVQVVKGPQHQASYRHRYRLSVEEGLPNMIASNLIKGFTISDRPYLIDSSTRDVGTSKKRPFASLYEGAL